MLTKDKNDQKIGVILFDLFFLLALREACSKTKMVVVNYGATEAQLPPAPRQMKKALTISAVAALALVYMRGTQQLIFSLWMRRCLERLVIASHIDLLCLVLLHRISPAKVHQPLADGVSSRLADGRSGRRNLQPRLDRARG